MQRTIGALADKPPVAPARNVQMVRPGRTLLIAGWVGACYDRVMSTAVVFTISDSRSIGEAADLSGPAAVEILAGLGISDVERRVISDDSDAIRTAVQQAAADATLVLTTGGTGISDRDRTPEAVRPLFDRELPGFGEIMRTGSYEKTPLSIISRGGAGIAGRTLIVMLPGSPNAVRDSLTLLGPAIRHVLKFLENRPVDCRTESGAGS